MLLGVVFCFLIYKCFKKVKIVNRVMTFLANKILFNTFIRTFIASYLVFALASFKNVKHLDFSHGTGDSISSAVAICMSMMVISSPLAIWVFLHKYFDRLNDVKIQNRVYSIYFGTDKKRFEAVIFNALFIARRLLLALTIVFLNEHPAMQV
jgi:hypothetical protein